MKKIVFLVVLILLLLPLAILTLKPSPETKMTTKTKAAAQTNELTPTSPEQETPSAYFYPLSNYSNRITERNHGEYFKASDKVTNAPCGKIFVGYHAGDDLETTVEEKEVEIPVVAIVKGKVLQVGFVSGYGGLVVQSAEIEGEPVTIYYGHMDLKSVNLKPGDDVSAGQIIGNLGDECSTETDDARKHLHFAIKKGTTVDVRGYVPTKEVLSNWLNPRDILKKLSAL